MENANKLIKLAFAIIIFCIGFYLMMYQTKTHHRMLITIREMCKEEELYQQVQVIDRELVPYGELVASLFYPLDFDVRIDNAFICKAEHDTNRIAIYGIQNTVYRKNYQYDEFGNIVMIIYTGIS